MTPSFDVIPVASWQRIRELEASLRRIAALDPTVDSPEGLNEWGEADCFNKAQEIAREALK